MKILNILLISACFVALAYGWCEAGKFQCQAGHTGCQQNDCQCLPGWRSTYPVSDKCEPFCGDNQVLIGYEQCDGGEGCCSCQCRAGYEPYNPPRTYCKKIDTPQPNCPPVSPPPLPPTPVAPTPVAPTPVAPTPVAPTPVAPTPVAPTPVAPTPVAPTPVAPTPVAPTPVAPTPVAPTPVAPTPVAPTPVAPTPTPVTPVSPPPPCEYVTYTRGGFNQEECHGNNVRCVLERNFACVSRTSIIIGRTDATCDYLSFTSPTAIATFIGGRGRIDGPLTSTATDPTSSPAGQLAFQLLTAELNVRLFHCVNGDCTGTPIEDLCFLRSSSCSGYTVGQVIDVANYRIAGCASTVSCPVAGLCSSSYTLQRLSDCLTEFNESFDDGRSNGDVGTCAAGLNASTKETSSANVMAASALLMGVAALL